MIIDFFDLSVVGFSSHKRIMDMSDNFPENLCLSDGIEKVWYAKKHYNKSICRRMFSFIKELIWT